MADSADSVILPAESRPEWGHRMNGNLTEERAGWDRGQREYEARLTRLPSAIDAGDASGNFDGDPLEGLFERIRLRGTAAAGIRSVGVRGASDSLPDAWETVLPGLE